MIGEILYYILSHPAVYRHQVTSASPSCIDATDILPFGQNESYPACRVHNKWNTIPTEYNCTILLKCMRIDFEVQEVKNKIFFNRKGKQKQSKLVSLRYFSLVFPELIFDLRSMTGPDLSSVPRSHGFRSMFTESR